MTRRILTDAEVLIEACRSDYTAGFQCACAGTIRRALGSGTKKGNG